MAQLWAVKRLLTCGFDHKFGLCLGLPAASWGGRHMFVPMDLICMHSGRGTAWGLGWGCCLLLRKEEGGAGFKQAEARSMPSVAIFSCVRNPGMFTLQVKGEGMTLPSNVSMIFTNMHPHSLEKTRAGMSNAKSLVQTILGNGSSDPLSCEILRFPCSLQTTELRCRYAHVGSFRVYRL